MKTQIFTWNIASFLKQYKTAIFTLTFWVLLFIWNTMIFWTHGINPPTKTDEFTALASEKTAYFAGGCFWCMEGIFEWQSWVRAARSGYIGWDAATANYDAVGSGRTKHREGVRVIYDPTVISYSELVELYWTQIDPTDPEGQFADKGYQYTTAIYYSDEDERVIAQKSKDTLTVSAKFEKPIATQIVAATEFFDAEEYHQDYYKKSAERYAQYAEGSGRKWFIAQNWKEKVWELSAKKYTEEELRSKLTQLQYKVTQEEGTEKPFSNEYWDNKEDGIYVDIIDGTPLYSSFDKFDSGTGWPSFTKPLDESSVREVEDNTFFSTRTEVRSASSDSHLGHVFPDGPKDAGGLRYCMNSASLRFVPVDELEEEWYEEYKKMFE
jgi:peptide methionine sulfoxide reductase msrA/msrB